MFVCNFVRGLSISILELIIDEVCQYLVLVLALGVESLVLSLALRTEYLSTRQHQNHSPLKIRSTCVYTLHVVYSLQLNQL